MAQRRDSDERTARIAKVLRTLGDRGTTLHQTKTAAALLGVSWSTVYRLRRRFQRDPVTSSLNPSLPGPSIGARTLGADAERVIDHVLTQWLPRQRRLAHPLRDVTMEVRRSCKLAGIEPVSRATVTRRWKTLREQQALALADEPGAALPPGHLLAGVPLFSVSKLTVRIGSNGADSVR